MKPGPKSEREEVRALIARAAEQKEEAWQLLWDRYAGQTRGLIRHLIRANNWFALEGWEEDALMESLIRLKHGIGGFRGESYAELGGFIRTNAYYACQQILRKLKGREQTGFDELPDPAPTRELEEVADCARLLRDAIDELPPDLSHIVYLNVAGWSSKEVAKQLGVPPQTVYDRKYRALCQLRERLGRDSFWEQCAPYVSEIRLSPGEWEA